MIRLILCPETKVAACMCVCVRMHAKPVIQGDFIRAVTNENSTDYRQ